MNKNKILNIAITFIPISLLFSPAINSILIVLLFSISVFCLVTRKNKIILNNNQLKYIIIFFVIFLLLHFIGLLYTSNYDEALNRIKVRYSLILIPFIIYANHKEINYSFIKRLFVLGVISACLYTNLHSIFNIITSNSSFVSFFKTTIRFKYEQLMIYKIHPPYFGIIINLAITLVYHEIFILKKIKLLNFIFVFVLLLNQFLLSGQMAISIFLLITIIFIFNMLFKRLNKKHVTIFLTINIACTLFLISNGQSLTRTYIDKYPITNQSNIILRINNLYEIGDLTRKNNWKSGIEAIKKNPFFGAGTGDAIDQMQKFRNKKLWIYTGDNVNAHNQYLEETVRFGFFGFSILIIFLFLVSNYVKNYLAQLIILIIFLFSMITESILNRQVGTVLFAFFISFIISETTIFKTKK